MILREAGTNALLRAPAARPKRRSHTEGADSRADRWLTQPLLAGMRCHVAPSVVSQTASTGRPHGTAVDTLTFAIRRQLRHSDYRRLPTRTGVRHAPRRRSVG